MTANELLEKIKKVIDEGNGDAILVHIDTRSGVSELCHTWGDVETVTEEDLEGDNYTDLEVGTKYINFYEGG